jgi:DNA-binding transcriptional LysR family regulator
LSAIKSLERELSAPLLERTCKHVTLTNEGTALLPKARAALGAAREAPGRGQRSSAAACAGRCGSA